MKQTIKKTAKQPTKPQSLHLHTQCAGLLPPPGPHPLPQPLHFHVQRILLPVQSLNLLPKTRHRLVGVPFSASVCELLVQLVVFDRYALELCAEGGERCRVLLWEAGVPRLLELGEGFGGRGLGFGV